MKELKIDINEDEICELMKVFKTEDEIEAVRMAINEILKKQSYERILSLKGKIGWEGNLDEMREKRL